MSSETSTERTVAADLRLRSVCSPGSSSRWPGSSARPIVVFMSRGPDARRHHPPEPHDLRRGRGRRGRVAHARAAGGPATTQSAPQMLGGRTRAALEREKTLALRSIKELEFDRAMGKVSEKDFAEMGARLRARAARLMRQLDAGTGYRERDRDRRLRRTGRRSLRGPKARIAGCRSRRTPDPASASLQHALRAARPTTPDARFCKNCGSEAGGARHESVQARASGARLVARWALCLRLVPCDVASARSRRSPCRTRR